MSDELVRRYLGDKGYQQLIEETRTLAESDAKQNRRHEFINRDEIVLANQRGDVLTLGRLSELPEWAQGYIKTLRAVIFDKEGK